MRISANTFIICFSLVLAGSCLSLKIAWAVPANYQAIQDLKKMEQEAPEVVFDVPQVEYTASSLRDPFEPALVKEERNEKKEEKPQTQNQSPMPSLSIQGIVWGGRLPQAIINNQVVNIGDIIQGIRLIDISKEGITVFYNGREQVISAPAVNMLKEQSLNPKGGVNETAD